jgi:hypothetical protein
MLVEREEIESAIAPLTDVLNDMLSVLAQELYPRLSKELLKGLWKELLHLFESLMLPSLFGSDTLIAYQPPRSKPLTQRQVQMLMGCLGILKAFFHADGDDMGLAENVLESPKYKDLCLIAEYYWKDRGDIKFLYSTLTGSSPDTEHEIQFKNTDLLLRLIRARMDKETRAYFDQEMRNRTDRQRIHQSIETT